MSDTCARRGLEVHSGLACFMEEEVLPGTGITEQAFWEGLESLVAELTPENIALLGERQRLQSLIDKFYLDRQGNPPCVDGLETFLREIGYIVDDDVDATVKTSRIDPEIAGIAGPQLVVPATNARFALNAANARWGSLFDALYGTDALGSAPPDGPYDPVRGAKVVAWSLDFLDEAIPLASGAHSGVREYSINSSGMLPVLRNPDQFRGSARRGGSLHLLFENNGLKIELVIDRTHLVGKTNMSGLADVRLEAAVTTIVDLEDSVATVDGTDKTHAYRNWLGLMRGDLTARFEKGGHMVTRSLAEDALWTSPVGHEFKTRARALLLVRNVGLLMTTPAVRDANGQEIFEGILDALVSATIALHDLKRQGGPANSPAGSVYVVKPKLHGPAEAAFADRCLVQVEDILGLDRNTVKIGVMDEERRTSVNLSACIGAVRERLAFINTGFLDRTGDEIHTAMEAGPMLPKTAMKTTRWLQAYERSNVEVGLACGLSNRAQIGKGMWAKPDAMADMLATKQEHPRAGANCAWVPSPTAATLHATHYHKTDVRARQAELVRHNAPPRLPDLLAVPVLGECKLTPEEIGRELDNNAQGILGYVVRWIDSGVGCSKVPDIDDVNLMEDRATCRISSQMLANWLHHDVVTRDEVMEALRRMAVVVDRQNAATPGYLPMAPGYDGLAFQAACDLVFKGHLQPSGYTEPILHARRLQAKARAATT